MRVINGELISNREYNKQRNIVMDRVFIDSIMEVFQLAKQGRGYLKPLKEAKDNLTPHMLKVLKSLNADEIVLEDEMVEDA